MSISRRSLWAALYSIFICGAALARTNPDHAPVKLAYRLTPGKPLNYKLVANIKAHAPILDNPEPSDIEGSLTIVYNATPKTLLADGTSDLDLKVSSAQLFLGTGKDKFEFPIPFETVEKMLNQTVTITKLGEITKTTGGGEAPFSVSIPGIDPTKLYAMMFPVVFKPAPVKAGDSWDFKNGFLGGQSAKPSFSVTVLPTDASAASLTRLDEKFSLPVDMKLDKEKKPIKPTEQPYRTRKGSITGTGKLDFDNTAGRLKKGSFKIQADVVEKLVGEPTMPDEPKEITTKVNVDVNVDLIPPPAAGSAGEAKKDKQ